MSTIGELNAEIKKLEDEILMLRNKIDKYKAQLAPGQQTALGIPAEIIGKIITENMKQITENMKQITIAKERIHIIERQIFEGSWLYTGVWSALRQSYLQLFCGPVRSVHVGSSTGSGPPTLPTSSLSSSSTSDVHGVEIKERDNTPQSSLRQRMKGKGVDSASLQR